jgi:hypothetical protein
VSTAEKIFQKAQSLPEQAQDKLLHIVEELVRESLSDPSSSLTLHETDSLYRFHHHTSHEAKPLSDREMDRMIYGG